MGTFGSFTTVRLGIYSAQKGLDVTGNNITNINTEGYTRQRLNQVSLIPSAVDRYSSTYSNRVGQGSLIAGITQLRDPGLDISYRKATSDVGSANAKLDGLNSLAKILDEVGKGDLEQDDGVILSQLNDMRDLISQAIASGGSSTYNDLIRSSAESLTTLFNSYADKLTKLQGTYETKLDQQVSEVNDILTQIRDLNLSIRDADLRGDPGLELRDQRNLLLDQLSEYMDIDVKYSMENVGANTQVEKLTVTLANGGKGTLVDGLYATQLSTQDPEAGDGKILARNPNYDPTKEITPQNKPYLMANGTPTIYANKAETVENENYTIVLSSLTDADGNQMNPNDYGVTLGETDLYGSLQSIRDILTGEGEFASEDDVKYDKDASTTRGIPYYQKALDSLAYEFATAMNELNNTGLIGTGAGNLFSMGSDTDDAETKDGTGKVTAHITASNISVSNSWANQKVSIQTTADPNAPSGDTSRLAEFLAVFDKEISFEPSHVQGDAAGSAFNGTFEDMLLKIQSTLAEDQMSTDAVLNNYTVTVGDLYVDREGVTGVDLNDEATNLMTYQKAYTAACRLMTTLNEALDSLINGMA